MDEWDQSEDNGPADGNWGDKKYVTPAYARALEGEEIVFPMPEEEQLPNVREDIRKETLAGADKE
jgi:hypothetical protein